ncbi:MAG: 3(or 17)beta-hydroxysteroid dehydrogenase [Gammaproteobacteria bacterium]|jgi:3(or 17)beta-hydroxysteroid dehydrogenase|nr:3(or 17)beta-hydroxysteroid dehydrogenase [Gammaproteobacteria bacterium]
MNRVAGKVALVTGAAQGLGKAIAATLVQEGARVYVTDINAALVAETAKAIGAAGYFEHDVIQEEQWRAHVAALVRKAGQLDVLVNNAGIAQLGGPNALEDVPLATWRKIIAVNCEGTLLGCQSALREMKQTGGGSIVNLSSIAALMPTPTIAAYGFSKAGVRHLTLSVAQHGAPFKIRCNSVHPGMIRTPMLLGLHHLHAEQTGVDERAEADPFLAAIPMGEYQSEQDIANGVLFLASDEARFITGTQLVIDGGMMLR